MNPPQPPAPATLLTWFMHALVVTLLAYAINDLSHARLLLERIDQRQQDFERRLERIEQTEPHRI
jgi:hypothetical protein